MAKQSLLTLISYNTWFFTMADAENFINKVYKKYDPKKYGTALSIIERPGKFYVIGTRHEVPN